VITMEYIKDLMRPAAARAEYELLHRSTRSISVESTIIGAHTYSTILIDADVAGWRTATFTLDGGWCIQAASLGISQQSENLGYDNADPENAMIQIKPVNMANYITLTQGPLSDLSHLTWSGRLIISGNWEIRARRYVSVPHQAAAHFAIMAEKLAEAA
jgi:hypothetical protein